MHTDFEVDLMCAQNTTSGVSVYADVYISPHSHKGVSSMPRHEQEYLELDFSDNRMSLQIYVCSLVFAYFLCTVVLST
jgi:hypothetical protein